MRKHRRHGSLVMALIASVVALASCASDRAVPTETVSVRVAALRARFVFPPLASAQRGVTTPATVTLPPRANGRVQIADDTSHVEVSFALRDASDVALATADGIALYVGALAGSDVVHRAHPEGTEDYVVFESKPAREEIAYDVDVSRVAGLRFVSNTIEFLDESGAPRLRIAPPVIVESGGASHAAALAIEGCAYDDAPTGPWGRAVTRPGAATCAVRVTWSGVRYPAILDPAWNATGSMSTVRFAGTATLLATGKVLMAGTQVNGNPVSSAELYDSASRTFAATGSMTGPRLGPTATLLSTGEVLVTGGTNMAYLSTAEVYDPSSGTFTGTGPMSIARLEHSATLLGTGKVLVAGGIDNAANHLSSAELFDPVAKRFVATGAMAAKRAGFTATVLASGDVLVAGGAAGLGAPDPALSSAEVYSPSSGAFTTTAGTMTIGRSEHVAVRLTSGKVLIAGGGTSAVDGNDQYYFDRYSSAELFDPTSRTFVATGSMKDFRAFSAAVLLPSGDVLVAGGTGGPLETGAPLASAETYSVAKGTFAAAAAMNAARTQHTVTLLASGEALAAGGVGLSSAETFGLSNAGVCTANIQCATGFCIDGVCCDTACTGQCEACDTQGAIGKCSPVTGATHGARPTCACEQGQCVAGATCAGDHVSQAAGDAGTQDCSPFICVMAKGTCGTTCTSVSDCASPNVCDPTGQCVAPPSAAATGGSSGGCVVSPRQSANGENALLVLAALAGFVGIAARRSSRRRDE